MERQPAETFVKLHAQADVEPVLSDAEIALCVTRSRIRDRDGLTPRDPLYTENIWATRAVVLALELKIARAHSITDFSADGTSISASQLVQNLKALKQTWRSKCREGSI